MAGHPPMYYTYILEQIDHPGHYYRGFTSDLTRRLFDHNSGKCHYTAKFRPWKLVFYAAFPTEELAVKFEAYLKTGSGHAFAQRHFGITKQISPQ